jgi:hypothetical protein
MINNEPYNLDTSDRENRSMSSHRLGRSASGTARSTGSTFDNAEPLSRGRLGLADLTPDELKAYARQYRERTAQAIALEDAWLEHQQAVHEAEVVRRRFERHEKMLRRRAESTDLREHRRPNHPVRVDVDPAAWDALKRNALLHRSTVGAAVAELVSWTVQDRVIPRPISKATSVRRFARLFIDEQTWAEFRALAFDARVTSGRLVGLLVERAARRLKTGDGE